MGMFQSLMYAVVAVVSVVIGAFLTYIFSRFSEERKHQQNMRTEAYVNFFSAALGRATLKSEDEDKKRESAVLLNDAKIRIAIYGGKEVVPKIAEFCSAGGRTETAEGRKLFVDICQAMRKESLPSLLKCKVKLKVKLDEKILRQLFGFDKGNDNTKSTISNRAIN